MTDYFDRIEAHLLDAVERQAHRRSTTLPAGFRGLHQEGVRLVRSWALAATSVVVVALVVGVVLATGTDHPRPSAVGAGTSASRAELVRLLGVLRRPQTAADRAFHHTGWPTPPRGPGSQIEPDRALIRLATVTPWGAKAFVVPLAPPTNPKGARSLGETVALWVQGIGWNDYSTVSAIESGSAWGPEATVRRPNGGLESRFFEIVPDGVAKVVFYRLRRMPRPGVPPQFSGSITARVHNNVAVFQDKASGNGASVVFAAWYAASGRLIKRVGAWNLGRTLQAPFPLAPHTQSGGWSDSPGPCPLAPPNPYLPRRSGCVSAAIANMNGQQALFLLYARLSNQRVDGGFSPTGYFALKIVRAGGPTFTLVGLPHPFVSPEIIFVRNVNGQPGTEIFVHDGHLSSGESVAVYTFDGRGVGEAGGFSYGGDSGLQHGLTCHRGEPATITQHQFLLETGGPNALWQETDTVYTWIGHKLRRTAQHTGRLRGTVDVGGLGFPPTNLTGIDC